MNEPRDISPRGRYLAWEQHQQGPCPICRAVIQQVSIAGPMRYHVVHDYHEHQRQGVPHVGLPMSRSDEQMYRAYGSWRERRKKQREVEAKRKAAMMRAREAEEPTESEKRAKEAAKAHLARQRDPSREAG